MHSSVAVGLGRNQTIQIQRLTSELEIQKYNHGVSQYLTNQAMLIMPQVVDTNPPHPEAFREMRAYGLNQLTPAGTRFDQLCGVEGGLHIFLAGSHHVDALFRSEVLLELKRNKTFVGRRDPAKILGQPFQMVRVNPTKVRKV